MSIAENLKKVQDRVSEAAVGAGRDPSEITIVAVTKTHPAATVEEALAAGVTDVGENRVQEFLEKREHVEAPCRWHLIGHLQTNKVSKVIGKFELIHSVDSLKLAEKLSAAGEREGVATDILVEVNTSGEEAKYGSIRSVSPRQAASGTNAKNAVVGTRRSPNTMGTARRYGNKRSRCTWTASTSVALVAFWAYTTPAL